MSVLSSLAERRFPPLLKCVFFLCWLLFPQAIVSMITQMKSFQRREFKDILCDQSNTFSVNFDLIVCIEGFDLIWMEIELMLK